MYFAMHPYLTGSSCTVVVDVEGADIDRWNSWKFYNIFLYFCWYVEL